MRTDWSRSPSEGESALGPTGSRRPSDLSRRLRSPLVVAASVAAGALVVAACGGGGSPTSNAVAHVGTSTAPKTAAGAGPSASGGTADPAASATALKFASCVRAHGVPDFPDSAVTISAGGGVEFRLSKGTVNPNSAQFKSAMQACQSLIPHAGSGSGPSTHQMDQLIKYSNCMRSHGVANFPEPNSDGQISVQITGGAANNPMNPGSPRFQAASRACRSLQPPGPTGL
ncbi:MAG TPA: hypothetical protein VMF65_17185 [Acidimicrobiales bacterium]|nr:hypothetical protein [Acidimicrobiales bacterium]